MSAMVRRIFSVIYLLRFLGPEPKFHPMLNRFYLLLLALISLGNSPALAQEKVLPESKQQVEISFAPLVKKTAPAVVNIYTKRTVSKKVQNPFMADPLFAPFFRNDVFGGQLKQQVEDALGSGVIIDPEGLVVTNYHVAGQCR
jgi:S1-C subfamily serine protease